MVARPAQSSHLEREVCMARFALVAGLAMVAGLLAPGVAESSATITVTTTADENSVDGGCSLREAIRSANTDTSIGGCTAGSGADTILVPPGTYTLTVGTVGEEFGLGGDLDVRDGDLTIVGSDVASTIVDGGGIDRIFDVRPAGPLISVAVSDLTVRGGDTSSGSFEDGGGIQNQGLLELTRVVVTGNHVGNALGGGIENLGPEANLNMHEGTVSGNTANSDGGGIANEDGGVIRLTGVTVSGNSNNTYGGGIGGFGGTIDLTNVTVTANVTGEEGGGLYAYPVGGPSTMSLNNVTVTGNSLDEASTQVTHGGGGIRQDSTAVVTLRNSIVAGNTNTGRALSSPSPTARERSRPRATTSSVTRPAARWPRAPETRSARRSIPGWDLSPTTEDQP
jgi:CSLREA domain-containing protein